MIPPEQAASASGANYETISPDYAHTLLTKGQEAFLKDGQGHVILRDCPM